MNKYVKTTRKRYGRVRFVFEYISCIALAAIFALFANALTGWFVVMAFLLLPVLSVLYTVLAHKYLTAEPAVFDNVVEKGESCDGVLTIKNSCILPTPPIVIELYTSRTLCAERERIVVSVRPRGESRVTLRYNAKMWGKSPVGVKSAAVWGFLGFMHLKIRGADSLSYVGIVPQIAEIPADSEAVRAIGGLCAVSADSEDTKEGRPSLNGTIGMEHREYIPGDPLKRINWKLSARTDELMIRLSDEVSASKQLVILDRFFDANGDSDRLSTAQNAVELYLGLLLVLIRLGFDGVALAYINKSWQSFSVEKYEDVEYLRMCMADFEFAEGGESRLPHDEMAGQSSIMVCTPFYSSKLSEELQKYRGQSELMIAAASSYVSEEAGLWLFLGEEGEK